MCEEFSMFVYYVLVRPAQILLVSDLTDPILVTYVVCVCRRDSFYY